MDFAQQLTGFSFFPPWDGRFLQTVKVKNLFVSMAYIKNIKLIHSESQSLKNERKLVMRHQKLQLLLLKEKKKI